MFEQTEAGIHRLCIPFEDIYTTVFLLIHEQHRILVDCATTEFDVHHYIIPALQAMDITPTMIICSHLHSDHCGGLKTLLEHYPFVTVGMFGTVPEYVKAPVHHFLDGEILGDRFQIFNLKGHSEDSLGILDLHTEVMLTFDSLQMYGISRWGTLVSDPAAYLDTLQRVQVLAPKKLIASHDYVPHGYCSHNAEEVERTLAVCAEAIDLGRLHGISD